jgi:5-methylthioadenosine/S-adenosylhomocysteine deaminase
MREQLTYAVHNPVSNLKLASGVMPLFKMLQIGVPVALGTDGASSNNKLSILREMQLGAILHNGVNQNSCAIDAKTIFSIATMGGAYAQSRYDCGEIAIGKRADLLIWNLDSVNNIPSYDGYATLAYSANERDIMLTMADGVILYEDGEYKTIDIEKIKDEAKRIITKTYF